jgi:hypothetical protein
LPVAKLLEGFGSGSLEFVALHGFGRAGNSDIMQSIARSASPAAPGRQARQLLLPRALFFFVSASGGDLNF